jgi:RNA polymerase primary sigma factor
MANDILMTYLGGIREPLLTREQEHELFSCVREEGPKSARARDRIIRANLRLVVSIAKRYAKMMPLIDLIQEGNLGLMRAIETFDHERGIKFSTYATPWIRQGVTKYLTQNLHMVRIPPHILSNRNKLNAILEDSDEPMSDQELATEAGITIKAVRAAMTSSMRLLSLQQPAYRSEGSANEGTLEGHIADPNAVNPFDSSSDAQLLVSVKKALQELTPREEAVLRLRFGISESPTDIKTYPAAMNGLGDA